MNDEQISRVIEEMEHSLAVEDPAFVHRIHTVRRNDNICCAAVFLLLGIGAVLFTVGLATAALLPWSGGAVAFIAAVLVDDCHKRSLH